MRVISGSARGKQLLAVPGMQTRPTTDRVKESIFNIIQMHIMGARVLDLFAGTGQLGIEALSRGAAHADFIEVHTVARQTLQKNITGARVQERATIYGKDYAEFLPQCYKQAYDIVFMDPPYGGKILQKALKTAERFDILSQTGIIICESAVEDQWETGFKQVRRYRYGTTCITILARADATDVQQQ